MCFASCLQEADVAEATEQSEAQQQYNSTTSTYGHELVVHARHQTVDKPMGRKCPIPNFEHADLVDSMLSDRVSLFAGESGRRHAWGCKRCWTEQHHNMFETCGNISKHPKTTEMSAMLFSVMALWCIVYEPRFCIGRLTVLIQVSSKTYLLSLSRSLLSHLSGNLHFSNRASTHILTKSTTSYFFNLIDTSDSFFCGSWVRFAFCCCGRENARSRGVADTRVGLQTSSARCWELRGNACKSFRWNVGGMRYRYCCVASRNPHLTVSGVTCYEMFLRCC